MINTEFNKEHEMIQWPGLLKLEGDNELLYLASKDALTLEAEALILDSNDLVIDSEGKCFKLATESSGQPELKKPHGTYGLADVTNLIQAHEFSKAQVCIVKIQFDSIHAAIESLRDQ
ncbi:hypothetical protein B6A42_21635 [Vibrio coralliilyticus]|nr:DUF4144 family protein [Vibrio coralliilyticus]ARC94211.1 hypothetical protein B6A42_21635 [Vibrio coralliilyticus]QOU32562.1 hypothetical protein TW71_017095 [Vibrio coralliilyticus]